MKSPLTKILWIFVFLGIAAVVVAFVIQVGRGMEEARASTCQGKMYWTATVLANYHADKGHFPPAYIEGPDGRPWHSWRVLLLPYMECQEIYDRYDFNEPWNGPNNSKLAGLGPVEILQCPSGDDLRHTDFTNYCVVVGENTLFPGTESTTLKDLYNTNSKSILLVEITDSDIHWMEPRDLSIDNLRPASGPRIGSPHLVGAGIMRANRDYERLPPGIPLDELKSQFKAEGLVLQP